MMRRLYSLLTFACAMPLLAATAHAQQTRFFQNSWFWGVHAGATGIGTPTEGSRGAATFGGEWLITRSMGGLYAAYDQANFSRMSSVADGSAIDGRRPVEIHDMRTASFGAVAFPGQVKHVRPYAGLGFAISVIGSATPTPDSTGTVSSDVASRADDARSRSTVFALLGAQWQIQRTAVFLQGTLMPSDNNFLASRSMTSVVLGVRYNFGSSIDR
jgi:hypothetical protein